MPRYRLSIESDDPNELVGVLRRLSDPALATAVVSTAVGAPALPAVAGVRQCSQGHGSMRLISPSAGGKQFPPFFKCDPCGEKQELPR